MTNQELKELISCFEGSSLQSMKLSTQEFTIELARAVAAAHAVIPAAVAAAPAVPAAAAAAAPAQEEGPVITAPLVGTFYAAPAPDQPPFVSVGQRVKKGETGCLIEAMKMMSEDPAPCHCVIEAVLKEDGQLAAFGEPLLRYKPC